MNRCLPTKGSVLACLLAASGLMLASCKTRMGSEDHSFGGATQQRLAADFHKDLTRLSEPEKEMTAATQGPAIPAGYSPWWAKGVDGALFANSAPVRHTLEDLFSRALMHSNRIKVFKDLPLIRQTGIQEAKGEFDTHLFAEATYELVDEPVGSLLRTGGASRFHQYETVLEAGVAKKLLSGANVTLSQKLAYTHNNSEFFVPERQAWAVLALSIEQPLLRGAGCKYNRSLIRIAKLDSQIARNEFVRQTETHLLEIARAYWNLYLSRALFAQKLKGVSESSSLAEKLQKRKDTAVESDLQRAQAALAKRRADLVRTEMAIKNAEDRIKALINDPELMKNGQVELLPGETPTMAPRPVQTRQVAVVALEHRPEIRQAFLQIKAAAIRKDMSKNEILPQLDLILRSSVAGLDKPGGIADGWNDQFHDGAHPGFLVGLRFDYPLENNTARARLLRRRLELRQQYSQLQTTVDTVLLEVEISARETQTSYREMLSRYEALDAAQKDVDTLQKRWDTHAGADGQGAIGYLQLLIDAQDRLSLAEQEFVESIAVYNVSMINLQRAQGTLLKYEDLVVSETEDSEGLPVLNLGKAAAAPAAPEPASAAAPTAAAPAAAPKATPAAPKATPAPKAAPMPEAAPPNAPAETAKKIPTPEEVKKAGEAKK